VLLIHHRHPLPPLQLHRLLFPNLGRSLRPLLHNGPPTLPAPLPTRAPRVRPRRRRAPRIRVRYRTARQSRLLLRRIHQVRLGLNNRRLRQERCRKGSQEEPNEWACQNAGEAEARSAESVGYVGRGGGGAGGGGVEFCVFRAVDVRDARFDCRGSGEEEVVEL